MQLPMPSVRMKVIPEPARGKRSVLEASSLDPSYRFFHGGNDVDLLCGQCGRELVTGLQSATHLQSVVLKCPDCGAFNDSGRHVEE
jgi:hypothetical protein